MYRVTVRIGTRPSRTYLSMNTIKILGMLIVAAFSAHAGTTGSISGTVKDQTGAVIPRAQLTVTNSAQGIQTKATADAGGVYSFPSLSIGKYDLQVEAGVGVIAGAGVGINARAVLIDLGGAHGGDAGGAAAVGGGG